VSEIQGIQVVAFDAVGTLLHPRPRAPAVYAEIGRRFGSRHSIEVIAGRFRAAFTQEEEQDRRNGFKTSEEREIARWRAIVSKVLDDINDSETCFQELFAHFARPESWSCDPDAEKILEHLAGQGYRLGIASNYDHRLRSVVAGIRSLGLLQHVVISSDVGWRKPAREFFAALCMALTAPPAQVLYIGDDPVNDLAGARDAGLMALLFDPQGRFATAGVPRIGSLQDVIGVLQ
jgi:putative hydrolase of the HAD superfamily